MSYHDQLKRKALKAIRDLHEDVGVDLETTLYDLEELIEELEIMCEGIETSIEINQQEEE